MSNYNDLFVSSVAMIGSVSAFAVAIGPWQQPYQLRTIAAVVERYGMFAARVVWISVAIVSLLAGGSIASGIRPGYAQPAPDAIGSEQ